MDSNCERFVAEEIDFSKRLNEPSHEGSRSSFCIAIPQNLGAKDSPRLGDTKTFLALQV